MDLNLDECFHNELEQHEQLPLKLQEQDGHIVLDVDDKKYAEEHGWGT